MNGSEQRAFRWGRLTKTVDGVCVLAGPPYWNRAQWALSVAGILAAVLLCQGCGTVAGYEINTNRHLIHVTRLADGSPAVGVSMLDWGALDWTTIAAGIGADCAAGYGAWQLYQSKHDSSSTASAPPANNTANIYGNSGPVTVNMKRGGK